MLLLLLLFLSGGALSSAAGATGVRLYLAIEVVAKKKTGMRN